MNRVKTEHAITRLQLEQNEEYFEQPLQAFRLIKRLVVDWAEVSELLAAHQAKDGMYRIDRGTAYLFTYSQFIRMQNIELQWTK